MRDARDIEALRDAGIGRVAPEAVAALYTEAFERFGAACLWSRMPTGRPTLAQTLAVAEALRNEGGMRAWRFAARIEAACRAAL